MRSESVSFVVAAAPEDVWTVVGERWAEVASLVPTIAHSELIDDSAVRPGGARRCTLARPVVGMEYVEERLVEWTPPTAFTYEVVAPPAGMRRLENRWTVEPVARGTRVTMTPTVEPRGGVSSRPFGGRAVGRMVRSLESDVDAMRTNVERPANAVSTDDLETE